MSVRWITWAWDQNCGSAARKLLLVALADHAGEEGSAFPGTGRLAEKTGMGNSTVRRHLDALEKDGFVTRDRRRRGDGTLGTYLYQLVDQRSPSSGGPALTVEHHQRSPLSGSPALTVERAEPSFPNRQIEPSVLCIDLDVEFERFWSAYGRVGPKKKARECWLKALKKTGGDPEPILNGVVAWRAYWDTPGAANVKWPQGWLTEERWNDPPPQTSSTLNTILQAAQRAEARRT
jgi:DNA-binding transcriptional ArsR family regulator